MIPNTNLKASLSYKNKNIRTSLSLGMIETSSVVLICIPFTNPKYPLWVIYITTY